MRFRPSRRRGVIGIATVAAIALAGTVAPAALAADVTPDSCDFNDTIFSVCTLTTNRLLVFSAKGGELVQGTMEKTGTRDVKGWIAGGSPKGKDVAYNAAAWDSYYMGESTRGASGVATFRSTTGALAQHSVGVDTDYEYFWPKDDGGFAPRCPDAGYYACFLPRSYSHAGTNRYPDKMTAYASIESRSLIVKVLNMTDQPLERSTEARATGAIRDEQVADPATVLPLGAKGPGVGYYHYFRNTSAGSSVTTSYTFRDGPGATSLTGSVLDINVDVASDGKTDASACSVPEGGAVTIQCSVTMLGLSDGILTALVSVGV